MPHISQIKNSKFLTRGDVGRGILVTVRECFEENVAREGAPAEMRWCLSFNEQEKPLVLNMTNANTIASIVGSENTDDWVGHQIVLFDDPNVQMQGRLVGGIRVRAPRTPQPPRQPVQPIQQLGPAKTAQRTAQTQQQPDPAVQADPLAPADDDVPF